MFLCSISFAEEIVALKRLKIEREREGFPITSLREINTLLKAQHPNIVAVRVSITIICDFGTDVEDALRSVFGAKMANFCLVWTPSNFREILHKIYCANPGAFATSVL